MTQWPAFLKGNEHLARKVSNILKPFRSLDRYFLRYVHPSSFSPQTLRAMLEKHGFYPVHLDDGGHDWRSPQNLFVIARKDQKAPASPVSLNREPDYVLHTLAKYRTIWRWQWHQDGMREAWP